MEYTKLGNTGLDVSRICLGCMGFGDPAKWIHSWVLGEGESRAIIKKALDLGINFFDTANVYSLGASEEILGRALKDFARRDEVVIATKVSEKMRDTPNGSGLSRKAIFHELDESLTRLGTDYIDLYIIHRFDPFTPIEETMCALNDAVRSGKVRYIGASSMYAWQFYKALSVSEKNGWAKFVSMQNHYNLLYREEEREMVPLCLDQKIAMTPYSPLASGRLVRDAGETTKRFEEDYIARAKYDGTADADREIIARTAALSKEKGITRVQTALSWLLHKSPVAAPVVGATKLSHLEGAVSALDVSLSKEEMAYLEEPYVPHKIVGHK